MYVKKGEVQSLKKIIEGYLEWLGEDENRGTLKDYRTADALLERIREEEAADCVGADSGALQPVDTTPRKVSVLKP